MQFFQIKAKFFLRSHRSSNTEAGIHLGSFIQTEAEKENGH